eukprot:9504097-Lingulodinium_polyedra.AAC.1
MLQTAGQCEKGLPPPQDTSPPGEEGSGSGARKPTSSEREGEEGGAPPKEDAPTGNEREGEEGGAPPITSLLAASVRARK